MNVRSLLRSKSLKTDAWKLTKYLSDFELGRGAGGGVQRSRGTQAALNQYVTVTFSMEKEMQINSDGMQYTVLKGPLYDSTVPNAHAPTENRRHGSENSFHHTEDIQSFP